MAKAPGRASLLGWAVSVAALAAWPASPPSLARTPVQAADVSGFTDFRSEARELRGLFSLIKSTLVHNAASFPGRTGEVRGFRAGTGYPQIWVRDGATILPASALLYEAPFLASWLEEILARQGSDGSLPDWIDASGRTGKNTTETDQEASAVRAAARISAAVGEAWLAKSVAGRPVIERLDLALRFVRERRLDPGLGLVKGAHTADWGDVDIRHPDDRAVRTDAGTFWTCDIYDQSIYYGAARDLALLLERSGRAAAASAWLEEAGRVREAAIRRLWQEEKGFFRVHVHLDGPRHPFDEDDIFAMGGNAEALLGGLATDAQADRIVRTALERSGRFGQPTIGASLLPPYPKGIFAHPMMDEPFEYQNGGKWDWFAGKLVRAMFDRGFAGPARRELLRIAARDLANGGLYEWIDPAGRGNGSAFFSGSAGSLALALFEGYFGLELSRAGLGLAPKLGRDSGRVFVRVPAAGLWAGYDYRWDEAAGRLTLRLETNAAGPTSVRILLPGPLAEAARGGTGPGIELRLDGRPAEARIETKGEDVFLIAPPRSIFKEAAVGRKTKEGHPGAT